ncbi:MAG: PQQ-binding-like beta-propeller repeat protein [Armatimonadota bacterium]
MTHRIPALLALIAITASLCAADDWPEILGSGRQAEWHETRILRQFPAAGPTVRWRTPVGAGFAGPAVAGGRVFVPDYQTREAGGVERVVCLEEQTGKVLWTYENPDANYKKFAYNTGPRAVPTVDGDLVYTQGAAGDLYCHSVTDGTLVWKVNLPASFGAKFPTWGFAGSPLVYGNVLIAHCGGEGNSRLVGFDKLTGKELWRALPSTGDLGYGSPMLVKAGGVDQLISWVGGEIASLNPLTGQVYWQQPFVGLTPCATPSSDGERLLVSNFYKGSCLLKLAADKPAAELLWLGKGENEVNTVGLHALMTTPLLAGDYLYGVCSYGQLRCLDARTGERVWESLEATKEKKRWANAFIIRNGDVYFLNNDRGELIIADLQPTGYREIARAQLIKPTTGGAGARELGKVNWALPAYANRHVFLRNDEEIIRVSLEE